MSILTTKSISTFLGDGSLLDKIGSSLSFQNRFVSKNSSRSVIIITRNYYFNGYSSDDTYSGFVICLEKKGLIFCVLRCGLYLDGKTMPVINDFVLF